MSSSHNIATRATVQPATAHRQAVDAYRARPVGRHSRPLITRAEIEAFERLTPEQLAILFGVTPATEKDDDELPLARGRRRTGRLSWLFADDGRPAEWSGIHASLFFSLSGSLGVPLPVHLAWADPDAEERRRTGS